ncbi:MAG: 30S ribosomal protein S18 [Candidatus Omnitrophota bacterium]|nr:MAG: 30S ribosomal protein S18 [Candidatus Omnitrophota bacterium]
MLIRKRTRNVKKKKKFLLARKKFCRLCVDKVKSIDYKDVKRLESFVRERGKIISPRISGNCAKHQRMVREAIKKARFVSLLPYTRI